MLMFIGCYSLCASALCNIILIGISIGRHIFVVFCNLHYILLVNGVLLIFNTLFVKLLRVYKIFSIKNLTRMNKSVWNNYSLTVVIFILCLIPNVFLAAWLTINPLSFPTDIMYTFGEHSLTAYKVPSCMGENIGLWSGAFVAYVFLISVLILMLAISTRKVRYVNFKDTKKVNIFLGTLVTVCTVSITVGLIFHNTGIYLAAVDITKIVGVSLLLPVLCQGFLFMPKVIPASCPNVTHEPPKSPMFTRFQHLSYSVSQRVFW